MRGIEAIKEFFKQTEDENEDDNMEEVSIKLDRSLTWTDETIGQESNCESLVAKQA